MKQHLCEVAPGRHFFVYHPVLIDGLAADFYTQGQLGGLRFARDLVSGLGGVRDQDQGANRKFMVCACADQ